MAAITFKLTQHTPLIHFQANQEDATLRASEVKPKLDRYLQKKFDKIPVYKLSIRSLKNENCRPIQEPVFINGQQQYDRKGNPKMRSFSPMYFGNMGNNQSSFKDYCLSSDCRVTIITQDKDAAFLDKAKTYIVRFFRTQNFGTRQSKGYGSFTAEIEGISQVDAPGTYYFTLPGDLNWYDVMTRLELFHKTLRSGINGPDDTSLYFKSMMFQYARSLERQWDKKSIKQVFLNKTEMEVQKERHGLKDPLSYSTTEREDFRDYLGFSGSSPETWRVNSGQTSYNERRRREEIRFNTFTIKKLFSDNSGKELSRFRAPFIYKPIKEGGKWKVLILLGDIPDKLSHGQVHISSDQRNRNALDMPMAQSFSLQGFFEFVYKNRGNVRSFFHNQNSTPRNESQYKWILEMYNNLNIIQP